MENKKYLFKKRLTLKSSYAQIFKAVRALGYELRTDYRGVVITWDSPSANVPGRFKCNIKSLQDERLPEWLNEQLEDHELLKPTENEI